VNMITMVIVIYFCFCCILYCYSKYTGQKINLLVGP